MFKHWTASLALAGALGTTAAAAADKQYSPGATDTEIKIGNTMPYSGPASSYGIIGKAEAAYFAMINDQGGINGRKINFISRDDSYSPPKTVEVVRKLVEEEGVLLLFNPLGTPSNSAIREYMNEKKIPQLFVSSGASKFNDPKHYPWTMGWQPSYLLEARVYARYILENLPDAKIAVLYQNDDFGKDYLNGLREGLGNKSDKMIVAIQSYETTDPTVDSQIVSLHGSGANVLLTAALPKFAAQTIRKVYDIGWKPTHFLTNVSGSLTAVIQPAGPEKATGIISAGYLPDVNAPDVQGAPEYKEWLAWMKRYNTSGNISDGTNVFAYSIAQTLVAVLNACRDTLTRENAMKQAASIHNLRLPMLKGPTSDLDIVISTSADDFAPIKQMRLAKFDGAKWVPFGDLISAESD